ncbi:uncharacterized protein LOC127080064 [Lathyrus oleraceus]|uniref:uncharacterized protein LOC127080064 n=1 Tax=Pisum sativum TaxID=3888 RepID=UPI0021D27BC6|nr:uncharacterized protein LOC127080064 [Pisum sativum]
MPLYAKFLKEILSNKRKRYDDNTVALAEECSVIIQNQMPPKLKDPVIFSIPCVIGKFLIDKALCDLGASVSLMPLSISERLNLDFVVMDIKEEFNILILLGNPFLATAGAIIDVKIRKLTLEFLKELLLEAPPAEELVVPPTPEVKDPEAELQLDAELEEFLAIT